MLAQLGMFLPQVQVSCPQLLNVYTLESIEGSTQVGLFRKLRALPRRCKCAFGAEASVHLCQTATACEDRDQDILEFLCRWMVNRFEIEIELRPQGVKQSAPRETIANHGEWHERTLMC